MTVDEHLGTPSVRSLQIGCDALFNMRCLENEEVNLCREDTPARLKNQNMFSFELDPDSWRNHG